MRVGEVGGSSGFIDGVQTDHHAGETACHLAGEVAGVGKAHLGSGAAAAADAGIGIHATENGVLVSHKKHLLFFMDFGLDGRLMFRKDSLCILTGANPFFSFCFFFVSETSV